jgi:phage tail-like protein
MRGTVAGLGSPHPLGATLPALYADDMFAQALCSAADEVIAPILLTLDCLPAYLDPATAPDDLIGWLGSWLGLVLDDQQTPERRRQMVRTGFELVRWRGTPRGVRDAVAAVFGAVPDVVERGRADWAEAPGGPGHNTAPVDEAALGGGAFGLLVRLPVPDPDKFDLRRLDAVVTAVKPAHIRHRVEVVGEAAHGATTGGDPGGGTGATAWPQPPA